MAKRKHSTDWGTVLMLRRQGLHAIRNLVTCGCVAFCGPAFAELSPWTPPLGLYDTAGYPYYPVETQLYGAQRSTPAIRTVRSETGESRPSRAAARARLNGPIVQVSRSPVAFLLGEHAQPLRLRPMPLPGSTIMDPWAVGVFR